MSQAEILAELAEAARKHLDPASPAPMRMMAARGLAPLPPRDMVAVLCGLCLDADAALAAAAKATLQKLPPKILAAALEAGLSASALLVLAPTLGGQDELLEKLVLERRTPDSAIAAIVATASERIAELVANNQERCQRCEAIVRALTANPNILRSSLDRLFDYLVRAGVIFDDMPEFAEAMVRLSPEEVQSAAEQIELPPELSPLLDEAAVDEARVEAAAEVIESAQNDEEAKEAKERVVPMYKLVSTLSIAKKVALAVKGNKEARALLVRDRNRVVASAAIRNPRTTEQEVIAAAQSRSVCDEVVRIIATTKDMTRSYGVKLALVSNPKTPLPHAMRFLSVLRQNDIKQIAKSKNVSSAVANQARRLLLAADKK